MTKSTTKVNYRKIYEQHHGPIPKDNKGISFDVHHIDGNRNNNAISNLIALSMEDHLYIHYLQGDWYACTMIASKMQLSQSEISAFASAAAKERIARGDHPFLDPEMHKRRVDKTKQDGTNPFYSSAKHREWALQRSAQGTHNWQGGEQSRANNAKMLADGSHPFSGDKNPVHKQLVLGTHSSNNPEKQRADQVKRVQEGSHHLVGGSIQRKLIEEGRHPTQIRKPCVHCGKMMPLPALSRFHNNNCKMRSDTGRVE
jgi:hypothetical protein